MGENDELVDSRTQKKREYARLRYRLISQGKWKSRTQSPQIRRKKLDRISETTEQTLLLNRTGDFWIDMGIVAFWRQSAPALGDINFNGDLLSVQNKDINLKLSDSSLIVSSSSKPNLENFLSDELARLRNDYWRKTRKGNWWWSPLANYFFSHLNKPEQLLSTPDQFILTQHGKWKLDLCDFCGRDDVQTKAAGATENPFMVVPGRMSNFYSNLQGEIRICAYCALATRFSLNGLLFTMNFRDQRLLAFCFEAGGLISLDRAYHAISRLVVEKEDYRNFKCMPTQYPMETFAGFLVRLEGELIKQQTPVDPFPEVNAVHIFSLVRAGKTTSVERYYSLPNLPRLFDIARDCRWSSQDRTYNALGETMSKMFFKQGNKFNTIPRELFCLELFNLRSISSSLEDFLYQWMKEEAETLGVFYGINIYKLVQEFCIKFLAMDPSVIRVTKSLGESVGNLAHEESQKSLLFSLRSCRNYEDVLAFFEQVLTRYIDKAGLFRELNSMLSALDQSNWKEYKSLISIYAALKFSEMRSREPKLEKLGVSA
jgi:hypothetical protein